MASPVIVTRAHAATPSSRAPFTDGRLARFGPLHRGWAKPPRCSHFPGCAQHADAARRAGPLTPDRARDRHGATLPRPSRPTTDPGDPGRSASTPPRRPAPPARPIPRPAPVRGSATQPQRRGCGISRRAQGWLQCERGQGRAQAARIDGCGRAPAFSGSPRWCPTGAGCRSRPAAPTLLDGEPVGSVLGWAGSADEQRGGPGRQSVAAVAQCPQQYWCPSTS